MTIDTKERMSSTTDPRSLRAYGPELGAAGHRSGRLLVHEFLASTARRLGSKTAVIAAERSVSYTELDALATRVANGLLARGARPGEVVGVQLPNTVEHVAVAYGLARAGLVCMPLNPRWTAREINVCMAEAGAGLIIGDGFVSPEEVLVAGGDEPVDVDLDENAPLHLRFTSGTTGTPKASLNTHRALALFQMSMASEFSVSEEDVHLAMAPLSHASIYFVQTTVYAGGTVVLQDGFEPDSLWAGCEAHGVTSTLVVPTILAMAIAAPGEASTLRNVVSLGAPLVSSLKARFLSRFPHVGLHEMYGATELSMVSNLRPEEQRRQPRSVGKPRFGYEVAIFDDEGRELPTNEVGLIYARGRSTHVGYVGSAQPAPAPAALSEAGWVTVGDLGHLDEEGFLFISDRRSDLILSGGMNVYPSEVEDVLAGCDGVVECAVIGLSDQTWGQAVTACVVGTATDDELDAWCRGALAGYKLPRRYVHVEELPKSAVGKVLRRELVALLDGSAV